MMMIKLIFLLLSQTKPRNSKKVSRGFTLVEVIVAMLILSVFIVTALTALVAGLNTKLKSKLANEATLIIQQDLEKVRYQAAIYGSPTVSDTPTTTSTSNPLTLTVPVRFSKVLSNSATLNANALKVGIETTAYTLKDASTTASTSLSVTADLTKISTSSSTTLTEALTTGAKTSIKVADTSKIKAGDRIVIGSDTSTNLLTTVVNDYGNSPSAEVVNVNINFTAPSGGYPVNTPVRVLPRSGDIIDSVTNTTGYATSCSAKTIASSFKTFLESLSPESLGSTVGYQAISDFNGRRTYTRKRTVTVAQDNATTPSVTRLQIVYNVRDTAVSPNQDLSTLIAEVIPNVAYQCP